MKPTELTPSAGGPQARTGRNKIGRITMTLSKDVEVKGKKELVNLYGIAGLPRR